MAPPPKPAAAAAAAAAAPRTAGSVIERIKRKTALLQGQLEAARRELGMAREEHELEQAELADENEQLRRRLAKAEAARAKADKAQRSAEAKLSRRKQNERQEAEVLEDFTSRMERNLEAALARAPAAQRPAVQSWPLSCRGCGRVPWAARRSSRCRRRRPS